MPQLVLEYSSNILEKNDILSIFPKFHAVLAQGLPINLSNCKSRAIESNLYYIGDGNPHHAFIHVDLKILPGRSDDTIKKVGERMMEILKNHFSGSLSKLQLQLSLSINELGKNHFKLQS